MTKRKPKEEHLPTGRPMIWTEDVAMKLANELMEWVEADDMNLFFQEFLTKRNCSRQRVHDMMSRFPVFADLIKRAKELQEFKLARLSATRKIDCATAIFVLKNLHSYADKQEIKSESTVFQTVKDLAKLKELDEAGLQERLRSLTEAQRN